MVTRSSVSRRRFMKTMAATASAPAVAAAASRGVAATNHQVWAAATVVRASISEGSPASLRLGVRVSVIAGDYRNENIVVTVEGVRFNASAEFTREAISEAVRARVTSELGAQGISLPEDQIAVQVFGGVL